MFSRQEAWDNMTQNGENIVIATHHSPDGDALGSAFGTALALHYAGKKPVVLLDEHSAKFNFLPGREFIYDGDIADLACDVFIAVDCGDKGRVSMAEDLLGRAPVTINIDHHVNNDGFAQHNYIDAVASSTCEVIWDIIKTRISITKEIATVLYTGICTDTGGFRHSATSPKTMAAVALLMGAGIDISDIQRRAMYSHSKVEAKIFATAIQKMQFMEEHPVAYTVLTQKDLNDVGAVYSDLDGIASYILDTEGIEVSVFFTERTHGKVKASFRSNSLDVREIAENFGGGGHKFAASGSFVAEVEEGVRLVLDAVKVALENQ
ncbi:MAG: bifunctional oligoribonuclease/PAP phosphatase NrnA [Defluviitaleaceae bacterium]|nr:bifunctional oligoribonuclease/PAP phosphatase NrnA [Defluviitaleaceae bacterium]